MKGFMDALILTIKILPCEGVGTVRSGWEERGRASPGRVSMLQQTQPLVFQLVSFLPSAVLAVLVLLSGSFPKGHSATLMGTFLPRPYCFW